MQPKQSWHSQNLLSLNSGLPRPSRAPLFRSPPWPWAGGQPAISNPLPRPVQRKAPKGTYPRHPTKPGQEEGKGRPGVKGGREGGGGWGSCSEHPARQSPLVSSCLKVETVQAYGTTFLGVGEASGRWEDKEAHKIRSRTGPRTDGGAASPSPTGWPIPGSRGRTANYYPLLPSPVEKEANALESGNNSLKVG